MQFHKNEISHLAQKLFNSVVHQPLPCVAAAFKISAPSQKMGSFTQMHTKTHAQTHTHTPAGRGRNLPLPE